MNPTEFKNTLNAEKPPSQMPLLLQALWHDRKGDWDTAHLLIQDEPGDEAAWIHAYLHRKEGDTGNADYWYRRANRKRPNITFHEEWENLVSALSTASSPK